MKYLLLALMLTGCSTTVPVTASFPEAPATLLQQCVDLQKLNDDAKLSDVTKSVALNYTTYYQCAVKNDAWIEWYRAQKAIFEKLK
jgi:hypothetical protein